MVAYVQRSLRKTCTEIKVQMRALTRMIAFHVLTAIRLNINAFVTAIQVELSQRYRAKLVTSKQSLLAFSEAIELCFDAFASHAA